MEFLKKKKKTVKHVSFNTEKILENINKKEECIRERVMNSSMHSYDSKSNSDINSDNSVNYSIKDHIINDNYSESDTSSEYGKVFKELKTKIYEDRCDPNYTKNPYREINPECCEIKDDLKTLFLLTCKHYVHVECIIEKFNDIVDFGSDNFYDMGCVRCGEKYKKEELIYIFFKIIEESKHYIKNNNNDRLIIEYENEYKNTKIKLDEEKELKKTNDILNDKCKCILSYAKTKL